MGMSVGSPDPWLLAGICQWAGPLIITPEPLPPEPFSRVNPLHVTFLLQVLIIALSLHRFGPRSANSSMSLSRELYYPCGSPTPSLPTPLKIVPYYPSSDSPTFRVPSISC